MKFQPDIVSGVNVVSRQESGRIWVGGTVFERSVLVPWQGAVLPWDAADVDALTPAHFEQIAALEPEVVIFGSGPRLRFVHPSLTRALTERRIGIETMDTPAACRTYNVLVSEQRRVLGALLLSGSNS